MMNAPVNGLNSVACQTIRALGTISFVTTRSAEISLGLLGCFSVGGPVIDCRRRGRGCTKRAVVGHVVSKRSYTVIASTNVPYVSSPNRSLIHLYTRGDVPVRMIPKPSTLVDTLTIDKLSASEFSFRNFPSIAGQDHFRQLTTYTGSSHALVFCRTPRGLVSALTSLCGFFNRQGVALYHRLAGIRRRVVQAALDRTRALCSRSRRPEKRCILMIRNTERTTRRRTAPRSTLRRIGTLITGNVENTSTYHRVTGAAKVSGDRLCSLLLRDGGS